MRILRFLLLVMLISSLLSIGSGKPEPKVSIPLCDGNMACIVPDSCTGSSGSTALVEVTKPVTISCEPIVKIRSYTSKHLLIVLKSYKADIDWIMLHQEEAGDFECMKNGDKVIAKYGGNEQTLLNFNKNNEPLFCEFEVKSTSDIFPVSGEDVELTFDKQTAGDEFKIAVDRFAFIFKPTCDPETIDGSTDADKEKTFTKVDAKLAELKCPSGYKLMFRENSASKFIEASKINCKKVKAVYLYEVTSINPSSSVLIPFASTFFAHCESTICTMCEMSMTPSSPGLSIEKDDNGCKKLKCDNGRRIKIGSSQAVDGSADCKYDTITEKPIWEFNGKTINNDATCVEKEKCNADLAKKWCPDCELDSNNLPKCKGNFSLKFRTSEVEVFCNDITGDLYFQEKGNRENNTDLRGETLKCEDKSSTDGKVDSASFDPKIIGYIIAPLIVIALIVGVVFGTRYYLNKKKKDAAFQNNLTNAKNNSKETKSAKSSKKVDESTKKEEKVVKDDSKLPKVAQIGSAAEYLARMKGQNAVPSDTSANKEKKIDDSKKRGKGQEEPSELTTAGGTVVIGQEGFAIPCAMEVTDVTREKDTEHFTHGGAIKPGNWMRRADKEDR